MRRVVDPAPTGEEYTDLPRLEGARRDVEDYAPQFARFHQLEVFRDQIVMPRPDEFSERENRFPSFPAEIREICLQFQFLFCCDALDLGALTGL